MIKTDPDFENLVNLLSVHNNASLRLKEIQTELDNALVDAVDEHKKTFAELQTAIGEAETSIRVIVGRHPEWFEVRKSLPTPFGTVSVKSTSSLDVPSPEATVRLIQAADKATEFLRTREEPNLEALERLTDPELAAFGIIRVKRESVSIKPASVDMGKLSKARDKKAAGQKGGK